MGSFQIEVQNLGGVWHYEKHHGAFLAAGGLKPPKSPAEDLSNAKKEGEHSSPSLRLINFVLHMYKQLTSEQRYTISVLLQKKCSLSFIAKTIGVCVSTVSREKRRNSNVQGVYDGRLAALKVRRRKATQRERAARKDHNHGQRDGVCSTWNHRKGIRNHGLLCTSILLLGKGRHREHERTCQAVPP